MAGPGGGPPRRSHTKSRKGCENCKRRHIRCDENFPQCRNCTKHKVRCPYNDVAAQDDSRSVTPDKPDLMWTPEVQVVVVDWQRTGIFPFPEMAILPGAFSCLSVEDMRLIYHVASLSHHIGRINLHSLTLWTQHIPHVLRIAVGHDYVLHSVLAFSAMHLSNLNTCPLLANKAYEHRGNAMRGLHAALGSFSRDTSEAILAASVVLSWQAPDWRNWNNLMQGAHMVMDLMVWKHESPMATLVNEMRTSGHQPSKPGLDDFNTIESAMAELQKVEAYLRQNQGEVRHVHDLTSFLRSAHKLRHDMPVERQFDLVRTLREYLFWRPVMLLRDAGHSPHAYVLTAHYYAAAILAERILPDLGAACFGSLCLQPVTAIENCFRAAAHSPDFKVPMALMAYPLQMISKFGARMCFPSPAPSLSPPAQHGSLKPNYCIGESSPGVVATASPAEFSYGDSSLFADHSPYGLGPAFSYSTEDLSVLAEDLSVLAEDLSVLAEGPPASAISPPQLSSPCGNPQYLGIPSPSYGGWSPVSSSFAGDYGDANSPLALSDNEDYASFDTTFPGPSPVFSAEGAYSAAISTTPTYPPSEYFRQMMMCAHLSAAPSPFLGPQHSGMCMLPQPDSPTFLAASPNFSGHRHSSSSASVLSTLWCKEEISN